MVESSFQFDYLGYFRNMLFLVVLLAIMMFILTKLKNRGSIQGVFPGLSFLNNPISSSGVDSKIEIIERKTLEPRKSLYLIRIFDEQYWLVGTTDTSIEALGQVHPPGYLSASDQAPKPFSEYLDKT